MRKKGRKAQIDRLSRIEGQIRGIKKMMVEERYCVDTLTQMRSAINALCSLRDAVLREHLESCVSDAFTGGEPAARQEKIGEILELVSWGSRD